MPITDERGPNEPIQPGDTVIELRNGEPVIYTQPEEEASASSGKVRKTNAEEG